MIMPFKKESLQKIYTIIFINEKYDGIKTSQILSSRMIFGVEISVTLC